MPATVEKKRMGRNVILFLLVLTLGAFLGCSSGLYTKMDSTAPTFGPIFMGISRVDAERHLGVPILTMPLEHGPYVNIYEVRMERPTRDVMFTDMMYFWTFGLGSYLISPMDRFERPKHLIAVTYDRENPDKELLTDRVIGITERLKSNPLAIYSAEKSLAYNQRGEWEEAIKHASTAISLDPQLSSSYINRAWAYSEKGLYDKAIQDSNRALSIAPKSSPALNNRGLAYQRKGELKLAMRDYKKACKLGLGVACSNLKGLIPKQPSPPLPDQPDTFLANY